VDLIPSQPRPQQVHRHARLAEVPESGTAQMFVLHEEEEPLHRDRARPGIRCYFLEGGRLVAEAEVI